MYFFMYLELLFWYKRMQQQKNKIIVHCHNFLFHYAQRKVQSNMANLFLSYEEHYERVDDE